VHKPYLNVIILCHAKCELGSKSHTNKFFDMYCDVYNPSRAAAVKRQHFVGRI